MMSYKQRDVVVVPFPHTDLLATSRRPALIVSNDSFNISNEDVIVCMITSRTHSIPHTIWIDPTDFETGSLQYQSKVKPQRIFTIKKSSIIKSIGKLTPAFYQKVFQSIVDLLREDT